MEEEERLKAEAAAKREEIKQREADRNKPVDDSQVIRDLFDFLPTDQTSEGEGEGFRFRWIPLNLHLSQSVISFLEHHPGVILVYSDLSLDT